MYILRLGTQSKTELLLGHLRHLFNKIEERLHTHTFLSIEDPDWYSILISVFV